MKISPIMQHQYQPHFKANSRWVYDKYGNELYKTTTYFFRDDLDWENLIRYLCNKYKDVSKVNFINHACSNGMEPMSFVMSFLLFAPELLKKFVPIIAKDINEENILMAKRGDCGASSDDFLRIHKMTNGKYRDFLDLTSKGKNDGLFTISPKKIITDNIVFEQGDIFKDIDNIPSSNTFFTCRNFWAYLPFEKREELGYKLSQKLDSTSTVLIGYHDVMEGRADLHLKLNGFKRCPTGTPYVNIMYSKD